MYDFCYELNAKGMHKIAIYADKKCTLLRGTNTERNTALQIRQKHRSSNTVNMSSKVTAPQDAHERFVLQVYLGSNTLEFSATHR